MGRLTMRANHAACASRDDDRNLILASVTSWHDAIVLDLEALGEDAESHAHFHALTQELREVARVQFDRAEAELWGNEDASEVETPESLPHLQNAIDSCFIPAELHMLSALLDIMLADLEAALGSDPAYQPRAER